MNYSFSNIGPSSVPVHPDPAAAAAAPPSSNASSAAFHPYGALAPSNQQSSHLATGALAFVPPYAAAAASVSYSYEDEDDDDLMPWERDGWVPLEKSGKQKTPNKIRGELQRYIDSCKADGTMTQTQIIELMKVNNNSFRRFMNPKTYKNQWSATDNGTYWAAARLLEQVKYDKEQAKKLGKKSGTKRKSDTSENGGDKKMKASSNGQPVATTTTTKTKAQLESEAMQLIQRILDVEGVPSNIVYDSCPQLVKKIKDFLARPGMTKKAFCTALDNLNNNSLGKFLAGKGQDQCGNVTYRAGYVFFEKLRILEGKPKSAARRKNETEHPEGFSLVKARACKWVFGAW